MLIALRHALMVIALVQPVIANAQTDPSDWKTDCVGRMQMSLPGDAEVGAHTVQSWQAERGNPNVSMRFSDETLAGWSRHIGWLVTHDLSPENLDALYAEDAWTRASFAARLKKHPNFPYVKNSLRIYSTDPLPGTGWSYEIKGVAYRQVMLVKLGSHLVRWTGGTDDDDPQGQQRLRQDFDLKRKNLRARPLFSLPNTAGICYPYIFLQDDMAEPWSRGVATTYRLKDHPDITVWLSDASAAGRVEKETSRHQGARYNAEFFWRTRYQKYQELTYLFSLPTRFPATRMAGYPGVESYVKLMREDGTLDYGYLVSVRGDPDAKEDEPDLMLYVIRDAAVARARGLEPYGDEKSFLALARSIAATVKRRPVVAGTAR